MEYSSTFFSQGITECSVGNKAILPGEKGSTVTSILSSSTSFRMSLPIRLNSIDLRAFLTLPFLLPMFSAKVFLDSGEIAKSPGRVVVDASWLGTNIGSLSNNLFVVSLLQLPWEVVASPVKLKILIPLKPFGAYLTHKSICSQKGLWR